MSDSHAAAGMDRLPWLADEPSPRATPAKRKVRDVTPWAVAAMMLVAGASFWLGTRSDSPRDVASAPRSTATVPLPPAATPSPTVPIAAPPQVAPAPAPEVHYAPPPEVRAAPQRRLRLTRAEAAEARRLAAERRTRELARPAPQETAQAAPAAAAAPAIVHPGPLRPWQPRVVNGAAGRLVEIGAFGTVTQAKLGWRYMVRSYPAVAHLPAVVRPDRNSKRRVYYRFRVGTTSQAHSEVLCQRMQRIHLSCAVVGLPWKAKVER
jgi:hypothetical protein